MIANLPVLPVILPLLAAPCCSMIPVKRLAWFLAFVISVLVLSSGIGLYLDVVSGQTIHYPVGDWFAPIGIELKIDAFAAFMLCLVSGLATITLLFAQVSIEAEVPSEKIPLFYTMFLLCLAGLCGMIVTNDAFNLFVFLEITSLSTYTLIAMGTHRKALIAGFEYLILGTIGATFYLIGVGLLYGMTGTLNISDLAQRLPAVEHVFAVQAGFAFLVLGLALKSALFPLHHWLVQSYAAAPSFVSSFLAGTATKVSVAVLIRIIFVVFGFDFSFGFFLFDDLLAGLAMLAIVIGSVAAFTSWNIKRMLAYSSVAQIGFILLGVSLGTPLGLTAAIVHLLNHAVAKSGLFLAMGLVQLRGGGHHLDELRGLGRRMPITMAMVVMGCFSLIGIPLTGGFISKWTLATAIFASHAWVHLGVLILGSLLAFAYCFRVLEVIYFKPRPEGLPPLQSISWIAVLPVVLLGMTSLALGIWGNETLAISGNIAMSLLRGGHAH